MKHLTRSSMLTWTAVAVCCLLASAGAGGAGIFPSDQFPVENGQYASENGTTFEPVGGVPVPYGVEIAGVRVVSHPGGPTVAPPPVGHEVLVDGFFDKWIEMDSAVSHAPWIEAPATNWRIRITNTSQQPTDNPQLFEIELLSFGGDAGAYLMVGPDGIPVALRESPTLQSVGEHSIETLPAGDFLIHSQFDVSLEASVDGGPFHPATDPLHMEFSIIPEPATLGLLSIGGWAVLRRRRKSQTAA
jgi:hypothetical protein